MNKKERIPALLVIGGPTASGKSSHAEDLASRFNIPIISADSRQIYRGFDIGTAKPPQEVLSRLRYEMIDILDPDEIFSAGKFAERTANLINSKYRNENVVIITGGTGFYITALIEGLADIPEINPEIEQKWNEILTEKGIEYLQKVMMTKDPEFIKKGDIQNRHRLLRAIKIVDQTGRSIFDFKHRSLLSEDHPIGYFALHHERQPLYDRIDQRVDKMIDAGLVEEVRKLLPYMECPAMRTVGYKELIPYLRNEISLTDAIEKIKQHSRNYAKRQLTWMRKHGDWIWIREDNTRSLMDWLESGQVGDD